MAKSPKEKMTELKRQLEELSRELDNAQEEKEQLESRHEALQSELVSVSGKLRRMERDLEYQKNDSGQKIEQLTAALRRMKSDLERKSAENEQLRANLEQTIADAKNIIAELTAKIEELSAPPQRYCTFERVNADKTVDIKYNGERMAVHFDPAIDVAKLVVGQILRLGPTFAVLQGAEPFSFDGEACTVREFLDDWRIIVSHRFDEERIVTLCEALKGNTKVGDRLLLDPKGQMALEKLPKLEVREFEIEEVPNVTFGDIGGLESQIAIVKENVIWPFLHKELFDSHNLKPIKGALFFGPPGNGKTMLGKAFANFIAHETQRLRGWDKPRSYFMYIAAPALLRGIVGQTEALMRDIFNTARTKGKDGDIPVIIFIDEMEAIAPVRGSGISSDIEKTNVPQLCALIDGLEELRNVIIIGASNRQDLIDSAILREGRLDLKVRIDRPNDAATKQIFSKHLTASLPINPKYFEKDVYIPTDSKGDPRKDEAGNVIEYHFDKDPQKVVDFFIDRAVKRIFSEKLDVMYRNKVREAINIKEFISGAMIKNIVDRAKLMSIRNHLLKGELVGLQTAYIMQAIIDAAKENEELVRHGSEVTDIRASIAGAGGKKEIRDVEGDDSIL